MKQIKVENGFIKGSIKVGKQVGFIEGDRLFDRTDDYINRTTVRRMASRLFSFGTDTRNLKVKYLGQYVPGCEISYNVYEATSAEGECKLLGLSYDRYEGGKYYELYFGEEK